MPENVRDLLLEFGKELVPVIVTLVRDRIAAGKTIEEDEILAELHARGLLNATQVDNWVAAHPRT